MIFGNKTVQNAFAPLATPLQSVKDYI